jgi:integrase/recombinase XerD
MTNKVYIKLEPQKVKNQTYVSIQFDSNQKIETELRINFKATWKKALKCWCIPGESFNPFIFFNHFKEIAEIDYSLLKGGSGTFSKNPATQHPPMKLPAGYLDALIIKRYSETTIKTYCSYFLDFQSYFSGKVIKHISPDRIHEYILHLIRENDISISQQNQRISAIKFYYEKVLGRDKMKFHIERPKRERKLPGVLDKEEVLAILNSTTNIKHKCILSLIYSAGLRRNELLNLKSEDIDSKRMLLKIRGGKGKKDRYTTLSGKLLQLLREYYKEFRPKNYLFEGPDGDQYSATSVQNILKRSAKIAGVKKRVHVHMLRHSFATHLLEQGTSLRIIQELLGHESIKTTEIYTHITKTDIEKIKNPLDDLFP